MRIVNRRRDQSDDAINEDVEDWVDEGEVLGSIYEARRRDRMGREKRFDPRRREENDKEAGVKPRIVEIPAAPPAPVMVPSFLPGSSGGESRVHPDRVVNIPEMGEVPVKVLRREVADEEAEGWIPTDVSVDMDVDIPDVDENRDANGNGDSGGSLESIDKGKGSVRRKSKEGSMERKRKLRTTTRIIDEVGSKTTEADMEEARKRAQVEEEKRHREKIDQYRKAKEKVTNEEKMKKGRDKSPYKQKKTALQKFAEEEGIDIEKDKYRQFPARIKGMLEEEPFDPVKFLLKTKVEGLTIGHWLEWSPLADRLFKKALKRMPKEKMVALMQNPDLHEYLMGQRGELLVLTVKRAMTLSRFSAHRARGQLD